MIDRISYISNFDFKRIRVENYVEFKSAISERNTKRTNTNITMQVEQVVRYDSQK